MELTELTEEFEWLVEQNLVDVDDGYDTVAVSSTALDDRLVQVVWNIENPKLALCKREGIPLEDRGARKENK